MRRRLSPLVAGLCILGFISVPAFATTQDSQSVDQIAKQLAQLQKQVNLLQAQLRTKNKQTSKSHSSTQNASNSSNSSYDTADSNKDAPIAGISTLPTSGTSYIPVDVDVPGQSFVSSGPYIGVPLQFSGMD